MNANVVRELSRVIASGDAVLFTGAGFSAGALDRGGQPLPDSEQMRAELWRLVFDDAAPDDSTLADLFDVALARRRDALLAYVDRRLRVSSVPQVARYAAWFARPWRRVYTLNVDDLEVLVAQHVPRRLRSVSATGDEVGLASDSLDVIHLNGMAAEGAPTLTFSTLQYAARLCGTEWGYRALAEDLARHPFVFVGTTLDEVVLWQHLELQRRNADRQVIAKGGFLIAPHLTRARSVLLEDLGLTWVPSTLEALDFLAEPEEPQRDVDTEPGERGEEQHERGR